MTSLNGLTDQQKIFVEKYLETVNGAEAARQADYAFPRQSAWENLSKPYIREIIEARLSLEAMGSNEVLWRLGEQGRGNIADFLVVDDEGANLNWDKVKHHGHIIKSITWTKYGPRLELYDAQGALDKIGKAHGIFKERREISGPGGGPIELSSNNVIRIVIHDDEDANGNGA